MGVKVTNNAFGTLSASISTSDTTITLDSGQGARFPTLGAGDYFYGTLVDTSNNIEVVKVTARSTDSMTVTRGADNTTAQAFAIGDRFELRPTAALFESLGELIEDPSPQLAADLDGNGNTIDLSGSTDALLLNKGTTAQRPSGTTTGRIRFNTTEDAFEVYSSTGWNVIKTSLFNFTDATFAGLSTGRTGPNLTQAQNAMTGTTTAFKTDSSVFSVSGGIQVFTIPQDGNYKFTVRGAKGGDDVSGGDAGGNGATVIGTVALSKSTVLHLLVGQSGVNNTVGSGGDGGGAGGGGSFVYNSSSSTLLFAAGGGGGADCSGSSPGGPGLTTTSGGANGTSTASGGTSGNGGGTIGSADGGGGSGAGYSGDGSIANTATDVTIVAKSFLNGGIGGDGAVDGGFGGGGGGSNVGAGGGGGGYSGGAGGEDGVGSGQAGGGGSYIISSATSTSSTQGNNSGSGTIKVELV